MQHQLKSFNAGDTIDAILKQVNDHNLSSDELSILRHTFNDMNDDEIPKMGRAYAVPILDRIIASRVLAEQQARLEAELAQSQETQ